MVLDFSSSLHYLLALLPEVVLSCWGMLLLVMGVAQKRRDGGGQVLGLIALAGLSLAALANGWLYSGVVEASGGGMIAVDRFRLFSNWLFILAAAMSIVLSLAYVQRQRLQAGEYYSLVLFAVVGMMFMAAARDLMVVFLGLELMSIAVYALVGFNRRDPRSAEAGLKYFLLGAFATGFLLFGIALVYGAAGSVNIGEVAVAVADGSAQGVLLVPGVALLAIGFAFKVAAVPFHMWTPDVYEGAPTPVTAFMAAAVKSAAFVAFLRVFAVGLEGVYDDWWRILYWVAVATMVVGNLVALAQSSVKRMLAYSSIAHGGYLLVAIVAANDTSVAALMLYLLVYTVMNIGAFGVVLTVADQTERGTRIEDYAGLGSRRPALGVFMTVFLLALAGFPGTAGFIAKYQLLLGAAEAQLWFLAVVLVLTTVVSYWYYLRVAWFMWMKDGDDESHAVAARARAPFAVHLVIVVGVGLILLGGIFPGALIDFAAGSVEGLRDLVGAGAAAAAP